VPKSLDASFGKNGRRKKGRGREEGYKKTRPVLLKGSGRGKGEKLRDMLSNRITRKKVIKGGKATERGPTD